MIMENGLTKGSTIHMQYTEAKALLHLLLHTCFLKILFSFRQKGRKGERGRETSVCGCFSRSPYWGPGLQPRHVP